MGGDGDGHRGEQGLRLAFCGARPRRRPPPRQAKPEAEKGELPLWAERGMGRRRTAEAAAARRGLVPQRDPRGRVPALRARDRLPHGARRGGERRRVRPDARLRGQRPRNDNLPARGGGGGDTLGRPRGAGDTSRVVPERREPGRRHKCGSGARRRKHGVAPYGRPIRHRHL